MSGEPEPGGAGWYAVYTRARHEKRVERLLVERRLETYLPLLRRVSRWSDRHQLVAWPVFPSYVFARFRRSDLHRILEVPGVARVVGPEGDITPIRPEELENVRRFVAALAGTGLRPRAVALFAAGDWVEVTEGPFAGVFGQVVAHRTGRRVLVGLPSLGVGLSVNLREAALRALPDGPP